MKTIIRKLFMLNRCIIIIYKLAIFKATEYIILNVGIKNVTATH